MSMIPNRLTRASACTTIVIAAAFLVGCAPSETDTAPAVTVSPTQAATPTSAPTPTPAAPLLVISGSVADAEGHSLSVTLTTTSVRAPSDQDRADLAATRCAAGDPEYGLPATSETRVVTMSVQSVASAGFTGWTDARGILVSGTLFAGPIWDAEAHATGATCFSDSRITRPGSGEVRVLTSAADWNLDKPVVGDASITLASYGFDAVTIDAAGTPTGLTTVSDCTTTASPEFDALALDLWTGRWGKSQNLPEYCFYGRTGGD